MASPALVAGRHAHQPQSMRRLTSESRPCAGATPTAAYLAGRAAPPPRCICYSEQPWSLDHRARRRFSRDWLQGACCPWSRSCWYGWGGSRSLSMASPRRLAAGRQAALASPRHGGTARGWTVSRPPTRGGRYFMNAHARLPIEKLSSSFAPAAVRLNVGRSTDRSSRKL